MHQAFFPFAQWNSIAIIFLFVLVSCQKHIELSDRITGTVTSNDATLADRITTIKSEGRNIGGRYDSDTMAAARNGGGIVVTGNSQMERWIYYMWNATWKGLPVINRGIGGTTWKSKTPYIQQTITDYSPKVIVMYDGENEYNGYNLRAATIAPAFHTYYDEVRRGNPKSYIIVLSMLTSPMMVSKGLSDDITALNDIYRSKVVADSLAGNKSIYINIDSAYPASDSSLWRTDFLHLNNYNPLVRAVKPVLVAAYNSADSESFFATDTVITDTIITDTVITDTIITDTIVSDTVAADIIRPVMFIGSSTIARWDINRSFPELNGHWAKAAFPGYKWSDIYYNLGDTVKRVSPRQVVIYSGDNDIVQKIPLANGRNGMQEWFQKICKEKIWAYDSTIIVTFMHTKPSNPTKTIVYPSGETGWSIIKYFNRNINNWLRKYYPNRSTASAETYYSNLYSDGTLIDEHYMGLNDVHWSETGYDVNDERLRPLIIDR